MGQVNNNTPPVQPPPAAARKPVNKNETETGAGLVSGLRQHPITRSFARMSWKMWHPTQTFAPSSSAQLPVMAEKTPLPRRAPAAWSMASSQTGRTLSITDGESSSDVLHDGHTQHTAGIPMGMNGTGLSPPPAVAAAAAATVLPPADPMHFHESQSTEETRVTSTRVSSSSSVLKMDTQTPVAGDTDEPAPVAVGRDISEDQGMVETKQGLTDNAGVQDTQEQQEDATGGSAESVPPRESQEDAISPLEEPIASDRPLSQVSDMSMK